MRRTALAISFLAFSMAGSIAEENRTVQVVKTSDYMALSEELQAIYVAGLVDGMAYMGLNYDLPDHDKWIACVRAAPLGELLKDANAYLAANPEFQKYPVTYSLAKAIGQRRPC